MIGIYCITNKVNNKKYFGQSTDIKEREKHYFNYENFPNDHLKNAFNKYGKENFEFQIIKCCKEKYLDRFEKLYIRINDTMNPNKGYNKDSGGHLNKHHSDESRKKMSESRKGEKNPNYGNPRNYKHSEETIKKMKKNHPDFSGENGQNWKDYPRIVKEGISKNKKQKYKIMYNGKKFCESVYKERLYERWYDKYPDIELIDETVID